MHVLFAVKLLLCLSNIILHATGSWLLYKLKQRGKGVNQIIFILHLSLSELCWSTLAGAKLMIRWVRGEDSTLSEYLKIIELTGVQWVYLISMIFITLDRFFHFFFLYTYQTKFTNQRVAIACNFLWLIGTCSCVGVALAFHFHDFDYINLFYKFIYPPLEITFLGAAVTAYTFIIYINRKKMVKQRIKEPSKTTLYNADTSIMATAVEQTQASELNCVEIPLVDTKSENEKYSSIVHQTKNRSIIRNNSGSKLPKETMLLRFLSINEKKTTEPKFIPHRHSIQGTIKTPQIYIPSLIIITFLVFIMIPDIVYITCKFILKKEVSEKYITVLWLLYMTGVLTDSLIYIFLQRNVRRELYKLCIKICCICKTWIIKN